MRAVARYASIVVTALAALLLVVPTASASPPVNVGTHQIDDLAGVGADTSAAQDALNQLRSKSNIGLFVVFIDSFDGTAVSDWSQSAFQMSNLGDNDMLWVISPSELRQGYTVGNAFPLSKTTVDSVLAGPLQTGKAGDWSGAIVAAAQGLQDAVANGGVASGSAGTSGHGSLAWIWIVVILAIVVIGFLWFRAAQRKKKAAAGTVRAPVRPQRQRADPDRQRRARE